MRRLMRLCAVLTTSCGLTVTGLTGTAHADTVNADYTVAYAGWTRLGVMPGRPGNAHSGYLGLGPSDYEFMIYDWRCPAGVTPPTVWNDEVPAADTTCTPLQHRATIGFGGTYPDQDGPVAISDRGQEAMEQIYPGNAPWQTVGYDYAFRRTGPITTTVDRGDGYRDVRRTAPMRLTGHFGPVRFTDPKVKVTIYDYYRQTDYLTG